MFLEIPCLCEPKAKSSLREIWRSHDNLIFRDCHAPAGARNDKIRKNRLSAVFLGRSLSFYCDSHASRRSFDYFHRGFDIVSVQVWHFPFGDFPYVFFSNLAHFGLKRVF